MATVAEIIDQVLRRLGEDPVAPIHWRRDEILDYIQEGIVELNLITGEIQATGSIPLNSTANLYDMPESAIAPLSARVNGRYLRRDAVEDLDEELIPKWQAAGSTASAPKLWAPLGLTLIAITPRPVVNLSMDVTYLAHPLPRQDASQETGLLPEYDIAVEDYAVSRAHFKDGGAEFQQSLADYTRYLDAAQQLAGRDVFERYPAWGVAPRTETAPVTPRGAAEPQQTPPPGRR